MKLRAGNYLNKGDPDDTWMNLVGDLPAGQRFAYQLVGDMVRLVPIGTEEEAAALRMFSSTVQPLPRQQGVHLRGFKLPIRATRQDMLEVIEHPSGEITFRLPPGFGVAGSHLTGPQKEHGILLARAREEGRAMPHEVDASTRHKMLERSPAVRALALFEAGDRCMWTGEPTRFRTRRGRSILDVHHLGGIASGDTADNVVAIGPDVHGWLHRGDPSECAEAEAVLQKRVAARRAELEGP